MPPDEEEPTITVTKRGSTFYSPDGRKFVELPDILPSPETVKKVKDAIESATKHLEEAAAKIREDAEDLKSS